MRNKVGGVVGVSSCSKLVPCHLAVINKHGDIIHFNHVLPHEQNPLAPWWFLGAYQGVSRSKQEAVLKQSGRKILFVSHKPGLALFVCAIVWLVLFFPWLIAWLLYPLYWSVKWGISGWKKRH